MFNASGSYRVSPTAKADGGKPPKTEAAAASIESGQTAWGSIYLCTLFTFCSSMQFTIFFTSLWPFMRILDPSVPESFFGLVIAMYSMSQIVASPLLGIWSNRIARLKPPLIICNLCMLLGNFLYFVVELFPSGHSRWVLIVSRLIAGFGWAQVSLLKSFAAASSVSADRARATALITGGVAMGVTLGPALQMLFTVIDYPGLPVCLFGSNRLCLNISMFTAAPLFATVVNVALMFLLVFWFKESFVGLAGLNKLEKTKNGNGTVSSAKWLPPYDRRAVAACYAIRFTQFFIFTNIETMGAAYAMMMFDWTPAQVVFWESISHSARGISSLVVYAAYIAFDLGKIVTDRIACLGSLIMLFLFHVLTFPWPFLPETVHQFNSSDNSSSSASSPGCDAGRMPWCSGLPRVSVWLYYSGIVLLIGLAFPTINVAMNTLFSRVLGPRMQSRQQGMLEMYGGVGRLLGPLLIGFLYMHYGPRAIWLVEGAEIVLMIALWLLCYPRLVPLRIIAPGTKSELSSSAQRMRHISVSGSIT